MFTHRRTDNRVMLPAFLKTVKGVRYAAHPGTALALVYR